MAKKTLKIEVLGDARGGEKALKGLGVTVEETGGQFDGFADKAAAAFTTGLAVNKIVDVGSELQRLGLAAETIGKKAETVFGDQLPVMQAWADDLNESLGVTDTTLLGMATNMADLLKPMGFTAEQAAGMSEDMLDLSGALSAWSGGARDAKDVSETLSAALLGERDGLKSLGISINQAEVDARALELAQADGRDAAGEMDKAMATQALILDKSTDAQKAWADGSLDAVKQQNELTATIAEMKEGLAQALFPAFAAVTGLIVNDVIPAFKTVGGFIADNKEAFLAAGLAITVALIPALAGMATSAWAAAAGMIAAAAPVIAIGVAVGALAAGIIWAYENVDIFRNSIDAAGRFLRDELLPIIVTVGEFYIDVYGAIVDFTIDKLVPAIMKVGSVMSDTWTAISTVVGPLIDGFVGQIRSIVDIGRDVIGFWVNVFTGDWSGAWDNIKGVVSSTIDLILAPIRSIADEFDGVIDTITGLPARITAAAAGMFDGIYDAFRSAINSIIGGWNDLSFTIGGGSYDPLGRFGPTITVPAFTFNTPNLPTLHGGGRFQAASPGGQGLAVLRDGEEVTPGRVIGGGTPTVINLIVDGRVLGRTIEDLSRVSALDIRLA